MKLERQIAELQAMHASQWFEKLKQGRPEDFAAFRDWCTQSPVHIREFLEITYLDREVEGLDLGQTEDLEALVREIRPRVQSLPKASELSASAATRSTHPSRQRWALAAAIAGLLLAGAWLARFWLGGPDNEYRTRVGELRTVELVDQSRVTLNTNSDIKVAFDDTARDVELRQGEAVFKVAHNPARPFRVHTRAGVIQAIGTQFNIYDRPEGIDVAVLEGRVRLTPRTLRNAETVPLDLAAGEEARIRLDGTIQPAKQPDVARVVAWSQRRLKFRNAPLEEIVHEFNRYHENVQLRLEGIAPGSHVFTGVFDADDPGTLARFLEKERDLSVERGNGEIVIRDR